MIARTDADWATLTSEYGRMVGDCITYQRALAEREAELVDARRRITELEAQVPRPPDDEGGSA